MNKKIKVIELLNKIANNEKLPVKIMFNTVAWELMKDEKDYRSTHTRERLLNDDDWILRHLNLEVEILEDEEEIEKMDPTKNYFKDGTDLVYKLMYSKINELVVKVNELEKNKVDYIQPYKE